MKQKTKDRPSILMLPAKKILLLYITVLSGHHRAAMAIEKAIKSLSPDSQICSINSFNYTNPILERIINRTYSGIIKRTPEVWEYLYDNPKVVKNTQRFKEMMHRFNSPKMKALIEDFSPDVIACTQAFPCGMVADYKNTNKSRIPLIGILTDFYPHSYWVYESVDRYVVSSEEARQRLLVNGVAPHKISIYGVPIDLSFKEQPDTAAVLDRLQLSYDRRTILIMGGSEGLGPIKNIVASLDRIRADIQMIVVTGRNIRLHNYLRRRTDRFRHPVRALGYVENINELMSISDLIVTKPGGLTVSESLAKNLPIIIINPIPGQEAKNTQFLVNNQVALKAENDEALAVIVDNLCSMPSKLQMMKQAAAAIGKPDSAINAAKMMLEL